MAFIDVVRQQVNYLTDQLISRQFKLKESSSYYDATYRVQSIGISTPPELRVLATAIGWPRMYIDTLVSRLQLLSFRAPNSEELVERINGWWESNNLDEEHILGIRDSLIYGRAYATVSKPNPDDPTADPDTPVIKIESPLHLYAEIDPRTNKVTRAIRLYQEQREVLFQWATLYLPNETIYLRFQANNWVIDDRDRHNLGVVPVVPLVPLTSRTG